MRFVNCVILTRMQEPGSAESPREFAPGTPRRAALRHALRTRWWVSAAAAGQAGGPGGRAARPPRARFGSLLCDAEPSRERPAWPSSRGSTAARRASGRATRRARRSPFGFLSCGDPDRSSIDYRAALLCVIFRRPTLHCCCDSTATRAPTPRPTRDGTITM